MYYIWQYVSFIQDHIFVLLKGVEHEDVENYRIHMANSALKCRIIILIIARSFCSYNSILINFGQLLLYNFQYCNFGHVYSM